MPHAFVDSSAVVATVFGAPQAAQLPRALGGFEALFAADLLRAEVLSALKREGLDGDAADETFGSVYWVVPNRSLHPECARVLRHGYLRGADLWHVACALYQAPEPKDLVFISLDKNQRRVALAVGFKVLPA